MNKQNEKTRFQEKIDTELRDLTGDASLADKVFALAERKKKTAEKTMPVYRYAAIIAVFLIAVPVMLMLARSGDNNDYSASPKESVREDLYNEGDLVKTYAYCPVCDRKTQWIRDCAADHITHTPDKGSDTVFAQDCRVCINCGNRYVFDELHRHSVFKDGTAVIQCPYIVPQQALLEKYPFAAQKALTEAREQHEQTYTEAYCGTCGKNTRWKAVCGEDAVLYLSHIKHSDGVHDCELTVIYANTCFECTECKTSVETSDIHLHLLKHNQGQDANPSKPDYGCPYLRSN